MRKIAFVLIWLLPYFGMAQISGNMVTEYQLGNLPATSPQYLNTVYNRTNLQYNYKNFKAFVMLENFGSQYQNRSYISPSQVGLQYSGNHFEVKLGNFFSTIGRGNLLRSFEIPGSILEDRSFRVRSYFYRDLFGGEAKFKSKYLDLKVLIASPLDNLYPPTEMFDIRRPERVSAINPEVKIKQYKLGSAFMLHESNFAQAGYMTNYLTGPVTKSSNLYIEYSNRVYHSTSSDESHALYAGYNFSKEKFGGSIEIKDYKNFLIGAGVNQPPALVREQTYRVLNRSIHVLQPSNESGFQVELFYEPKSNHMLTFNQTVNKNYFGKNFYYTETFLEYNADFENNTTLKIFADYAIDNLKVEKHRISGGALYEFGIGSKQKIKLETEQQTFQRLDKKVYNQVYAITYHPFAKLSFTPVLECSNDPFLTNQHTRLWFGSNLKYNFNSKLSMQLFAGKRRGGPSCNAGICYEVLDFEGVEIRTNWRF